MNGITFWRPLIQMFCYENQNSLWTLPFYRGTPNALSHRASNWLCEILLGFLLLNRKQIYEIRGQVVRPSRWPQRINMRWYFALYNSRHTKDLYKGIIANILNTKYLKALGLAYTNSIYFLQTREFAQTTHGSNWPRGRNLQRCFCGVSPRSFVVNVFRV